MSAAVKSLPISTASACLAAEKVSNRPAMMVSMPAPSAVVGAGGPARRGERRLAFFGLHLEALLRLHAPALVEHLQQRRFLGPGKGRRVLHRFFLEHEVRDRLLIALLPDTPLGEARGYKNSHSLRAHSCLRGGQ